MKRYALPLIIVGVIVVLIALMFVGGSSSPNYAGGDATEQPISQEWVRGNASSTVKLIEYTDFQCPACTAYYPMLKQLETKYATSVAFIVREYPLYTIHANADIAARAAEAAGKKGKFWEMHDKLFENHDAWAELLNPESVLVGYATELGLNLDEFKKDIASSEVKKLVADDYQRGQKDNISGTPTFILNGVRLQNPNSIEGFEAILQTALATTK
jgi:protein-disulfide isomerase